MDDQNKITDETGATVKPIDEIEDFDDVAVALEKPSDSEPEKPDGQKEVSATVSKTPAAPPATNFIMREAEEKTENSSTTGVVQFISIDKITANPYQPRKIFNPEKLAELAESIKLQGIIQPLVLVKSSDGYEILVGERRYRAALLAGLTEVPAIVRGEISDRAKLELALIENVQREDLNPIEEARAYSRLAEEFDLTQDQIAKKVGKSRPAVANVMRLLNLPAQIQRAVIEEKLTEGHARALLPLEADPQKQMEVFEWVLREQVTVRQTENKVREIKNLPLKPYIRASKIKQPDPELRQIEENLREKLGTKVRLHKSGDSGKIMIEFYSKDELQDIIQKLIQENSGKQPVDN